MKITERELVHSAVDQLKGALSDFPQVRLTSEKFEVPTEGRYRADALLGLEVNGKPCAIVLEAKTLLPPARLRSFLYEPQWRNATRQPGVYGVVAAPYFSEDSIKQCQEAGVGAVDVRGNCWLNFGGIVVKHQVKMKRESVIPVDRSLSSLRYPKAQRVLLGLLDGGSRDWKMQDIATACQVSLGQVFKVCQWLAEQEWADRPRRGHFKVVKPEAVLDALAAVYQPKNLEQVYFFTPVDDLRGVENTLASKTAGLGELPVLCGFSAARRWAPFVRHLRAQLYVPGNIAEIARSSNLKLEPAQQGANVVLTVPPNDNVYFGAKDREGTLVTSLVQTYLDLLKEPLRGQEAAEKVREAWMESFQKGESR